MTDLSEAVFGKSAVSDETAELEKISQLNDDDPESLFRASLGEVERMRHELEAENSQLEQSFPFKEELSQKGVSSDAEPAAAPKRSSEPQENPAIPKMPVATAASAASELPRQQAVSHKSPQLQERKQSETAAPVQPHEHTFYSVGMLTAAVSLVFMGIAMLVSLNSPIGQYSALKLSPVILVFLGLEAGFVMIKRRSLYIKVDVKSIVVVAVLIALSGTMSLISVNGTANDSERVYAQERIQNLIAGELRDKIAHEYVRNVNIEINLYGENAAIYETPADLTDGDMINLVIYFSDAQMSIREFAYDCRDILDAVLTLRYNFGTIKFIAEDSVNTYSLDVDCLYQSEFSGDKLAGMVNFFGDGISDTDIPDITDTEE